MLQELYRGCRDKHQGAGTVWKPGKLPRERAGKLTLESEWELASERERTFSRQTELPGQRPEGQGDH